MQDLRRRVFVMQDAISVAVPHLVFVLCSLKCCFFNSVIHFTLFNLYLVHLGGCFPWSCPLLGIPIFISSSLFCLSAKVTSIRKTCRYNFYPLKPHFYIVKLKFTRVCILFLISAKKKNRLWVLVRTASYSVMPKSKNNIINKKKKKNLTSLSVVDSPRSFAASSDIGRKLLLDLMSFNTFNMIILLFAWKQKKINK